jgi:hypothetical protein
VEALRLNGKERGAKEDEIASLDDIVRHEESALNAILHAPLDSTWIAKQLNDKQDALTGVKSQIDDMSTKLQVLVDLANQADDHEDDCNIESKWLEEINILHNNMNQMRDEASKAVDVEKLEKSFESNLSFLREQIKSEIGAKADQIQLEDALREVVEKVEAVQGEPDEDAKVEALHAALNLIHREMQGKADAGRLHELDENLRTLEHRGRLADGPEGALMRTPISSTCLACDRPFTGGAELRDLGPLRPTTHGSGLPSLAGSQASPSHPYGLGRTTPLAAPPQTADGGGPYHLDTSGELNTWQQSENWTKASHSRANHFFRRGPLHPGKDFSATSKISA